jgi:hypothetical protein
MGDSKGNKDAPGTVKPPGGGQVPIKWPHPAPKGK